MPLTACRNSIWFDFCDCLKMAIFGSRMGIGYLPIIFLPTIFLPIFSSVSSVHHISATTGPSLLKFCMLLPYDIMWTCFSLIFEIFIFWYFFIFSKNTQFLTSRQSTMVHHISATTGSSLPKFCMQLSYDDMWTNFSLIFEIFIFWPVFKFSKNTSFLTSQQSTKVHRISATTGPSLPKFCMQLPYDIMWTRFSLIFEICIFWPFFLIFKKTLCF